MFSRIAFACLMLAAASAHATCQLGAVSGAIPWDAMTCPTDPSISGPNLNYSVTLTGPSVLSPPGHMPATGDNVMTLWVTYAAGGTLALDQGFWSDDPNIKQGQQPPFSNTAGLFDSVVCQSHATTNPAGQGPWCKFSYNIHQIGPSPAPPTPWLNGGVAGISSGTKVNLPLAAAPGNTIIVAAYTGHTTGMTVIDDTGDTFTPFDTSATHTGHPISMFKSEKITGSPKNFTLTIGASDYAAMRVDVLVGGAVSGSTGFTDQYNAPAGTDAIKSKPLTAAVGDILYSLTFCACQPLTSISAGTGYMLATPPDLVVGPMNAEYATAAKAGSTTAAFTIADAGRNWNTDFMRLGSK